MAGRPDLYQEYVQKIAEEIGVDLLPFISPEERVRGLQPDDLVRVLTPEERVRGLQPEERVRGLAAEEILRGLDLETLEKLKQLLDGQGK